MPGELAIIERIRKRVAVLPSRGLVLGIGDDAAIFRPTGSWEDLVFTTDQVVEGVHFRSGTSARRIGSKALARALSDIAAMGAAPRFCLISLVIPRRFDIDAFYRGVTSIARRYQVAVAGGDLAKSSRISCDVIVCGSLPRGTALRRDGARSGDTVYVSGPLGGNASRNYRDVPKPRIDVGKRLRGSATACMDISDGLSIDLYRLCLSSSTAALLDSLPVATGANEHQALHGGEDYELLYTGPANLPGFRIGTISDGPTGGITLRGFPLTPELGYDHFSKR